MQSSKRRLASYSGWRETFSWAEAGSKARFLELAEIYAAVARKGADAFYRSQSTEVLIDELRQRGVPVTYTGSAEHRREKVTPIKCARRDCELHEPPPNTQGLSTLQLSNAVEVTELWFARRSSAGARRKFFLSEES